MLPTRATSAAATTALCGLMMVGCSGDGPASDQPQVTAQASRSDANETSAISDMTPVDELVGVPGDPAAKLIGAWDYKYGSADARRLIANFQGLVDPDTKEVVARLGFMKEHKWWLGFFFDGDLILVHGVPEGDGGTFAVHGNQLATSGAHDTVLVTYRWTLQGNKLSLTAIEECLIAGAAKTDCKRQRSRMDPLMRMITENTFVRSADQATY